MSFYNLRLSFRYLYKNKVYSTLILGGFAIGFSVCILIALYYYTEKSVNTGFQNHKEIYRIWDTKKNTYNINYDLSALLATNYAEIAQTCPMDFFTGIEFYAKDEEKNKSVVLNSLIGTTNAFAGIFSIEILESISNQLFGEKESFAITRTFAQKLYKNESAIGKTLTIGNTYIQVTGKVTSVIEELPENSSFTAEVLINVENKDYQLSETCEHGNCYYPTNQFLQLVHNADADSLIAHLNSTINLKSFDAGQIGLQQFDDIYLSALPIKDMHFKGNLKLLKIFVSIAILILVLSTINYINYGLSLQLTKLRSIGISQINGAKWKQLILFSFTEVTLGIFISLICAFFFTSLLLPFSDILFGKELPINSTLILQILTLIVIVALCIIACNLLLQFYFLSHFSITDFITGTKKRSGKEAGRRILLVLQITVSIILISTSLGIFKQLNFTKESDLGFDKELLLRIDLIDLGLKKNAFRQEIDKLPFVSNSAFSNGGPGRITLRMNSNIQDNDFQANCIIIGDRYLQTMGMELLEGREFQPSDDNTVCLFNETAFRQSGFQKLEGGKFNNGAEGGYEVIGIIRDFHISAFYNSIEPVVLIYSPEAAIEMLSIRLLPGNIQIHLKQLEQVWKKFQPYETMNYTFYDQHFQSMYEKDEKLAQSIAFYSFIAIVLTCMGILSQIIMTSLLRTKEIGIRKVNGAKISEILILLNLNYIKWVIIAFVIAAPVSWYALNSWLQNFAYKTTLNAWLFLASVSLTMVLVLLTVSLQSWKAATLNPVEALRYE